MIGNSQQRLDPVKAIRTIGRSLYPAGWSIDRGAIATVLAGLAMAAVTYLAIAPDKSRLAVFTPEHADVFPMFDSLPQRLALFAFIIVVAAGAALIALFRDRAVYRMPAECSDGLALALGIAALVLLAWSFKLLDEYVRLDVRSLAGFAIAAVPYAVLSAVFVFADRLPRAVVRGAMALLVAFVIFAPLTGLMLRVLPDELPMIDHHVTIIFAGGELLAAGYRLIADVPVTYGFLLPVAIAGAIKSGHGPDVGGLVHIAEAFQLATFVVCLMAAWKRPAAAGPSARETSLFFVLLVVAPFLTLANLAVLYPNVSGARYIMLPVAALASLALERWRFVTASLLVGAVASLAILLNPETGVAVTAGLGLGWLYRARTLPPAEWGSAMLAGAFPFAAILGAAVLGHKLALGSWPECCGAAASGDSPGFAQSFAMGYNGQRLVVSPIILAMLATAAYVVVRALAALLGRRVIELRISDVAIAGVLFAWLPYFAARSQHGNLWPYLTLFALLIAPAVANMRGNSIRLTAILVLLLVPFGLGMLKTDAKRIIDASAGGYVSKCAAGLALPAKACEAFNARAVELVRLATPGDTGWLTAYPITTLHTARLKPFIAAFDPFAAARTENALDAVARDFRAKNPVALLLDKPGAPVVADPIPKGIRAIHERIATRAGYAPCPLLPFQYWEAWLPSGACTPASPVVAKLKTRA